MKQFYHLLIPATITMIVVVRTALRRVPLGSIILLGIPLGVILRIPLRIAVRVAVGVAVSIAVRIAHRLRKHDIPVQGQWLLLLPFQVTVLLLLRLPLMIA
jgi:hypothetical protein